MKGKLLQISFFIITGFAFFSCTETSQSTEESIVERENNTKTIQPLFPEKVLNVAFVIVDGVYNSELVAPMDIFHHTVFHTEKGMRVFTVAPTLESITTFEGLRIIPDYAFSSEDLPEIDVLVVPSAENSMGKDLENEELIGFVTEKGGSAQYAMSLCDGAFVLARAGLVDGWYPLLFPVILGVTGRCSRSWMCGKE